MKYFRDVLMKIEISLVPLRNLTLETENDNRNKSKPNAQFGLFDFESNA